MPCFYHLKKRVKYGKKYYAHDENNIAHVGDTVTIMETRPLSALKRFRLVSIDKLAVETVEVKEVEVEEKVFPKIFACPVCSKRLKASKAGRFRCSECKTILAIDNQAQVFLG